MEKIITTELTESTAKLLRQTALDTEQKIKTVVEESLKFACNNQKFLAGLKKEKK